jgi:hypothetical protein
LGQRLDAAGAAGQHDAVDDGTGPGSVHGIAEQPTLLPVAKILQTVSKVLRRLTSYNRKL